jgi:hypothetical protein
MSCRWTDVASTEARAHVRVLYGRKRVVLWLRFADDQGNQCAREVWLDAGQLAQLAARAETMYM